MTDSLVYIFLTLIIIKIITHKYTINAKHLTILALRSGYLDPDYTSIVKYFIVIFFKGLVVKKKHGNCQIVAKKPEQSLTDEILLSNSGKISEALFAKYLNSPFQVIGEKDILNAVLMGLILSCEQSNTIIQELNKLELKECKKKLIGVLSFFNKKMKALHEKSDDKLLMNLLYEIQTLIREDHKESNDAKLLAYLIETYTKKSNTHGEKAGLDFVNSFNALCAEYIKTIMITKKTLKENSSDELLERLKRLEHMDGSDSKMELKTNSYSVVMYTKLLHLRRGKTKSALFQALLFGKELNDISIKNSLLNPLHEKNDIIFIQKLLDDLEKETRINNFLTSLRSGLKMINLLPLRSEFINHSNIFPDLIKIAAYSNIAKAIDMLNKMNNFHNKMDLYTDSGIAFMEAMRKYESDAHRILYNYFNGIVYYKKNVSKKDVNRNGLQKTVYNKFNEMFTSYDLNSANLTMLKIMSCGNIPVNYEWTCICNELLPDCKDYPYFKQLMTENKELRQCIIGKILSEKTLMSQSDAMMENLVITLHKNLNTDAIVLQKDELVVAGNHNTVKDDHLIGFKRFCFVVTKLEYAVKLEQISNPLKVDNYRIVCSDGDKLRDFMMKNL